MYVRAGRAIWIALRVPFALARGFFFEKIVEWLFVSAGFAALSRGLVSKCFPLNPTAYARHVKSILTLIILFAEISVLLSRG